MAATCETLIGLLAVTGMRVGEVIALDRDDLDWARGLLTVRRAKFGKSREIPLHSSTLDALLSMRHKLGSLSRMKARQVYRPDALTAIVTPRAP